MSFAELFESSTPKAKKNTLGELIHGIVVKIESDFVWVDAGFKSEGQIDIAEFKNANNEVEVNVGDQVDVVLESIEDGEGRTVLSREKAKRLESWARLEKAHEDKEIVKGIVDGKVKGGFTVAIDNIRAFLPGSLVDSRSQNEQLEGKELEFLVIKLDKERNNVVVSRRAVLDEDDSVNRDEVLANLEEGKIVKGKVKNLTDYGAFVDLGAGVDGLLHITDMAWKRVKNPGEVVTVGEEIEVKVLKFEKERQRVSLGLKQLTADPWTDVDKRYPKGSEIEGVVTNIADYGCFVEIEEGVEGLVHVSEMDWTNKNVQPSSVVNIGEKVKVKVLEISEQGRRISLGLKQCKPNPWQIFSEKHAKGDKVVGKVKSITDFGIFIGLEGGIDGLVHNTDLSHDNNGEAAHKYTRGEEVTAVVLNVDPEKERISLGVKQLEEDAISKFLDAHRESIFKGTIEAVEANRITVDLGDGIKGVIRASDASSDRIDDLTTAFTVGSTVEAKKVGIDRKNGTISLSIRAKDEAEDRAAIEAIKKSNSEVEKGSSAMAEAFKNAKQ
jgi:small subunit ribosomal protein S1